LKQTNDASAKDGEGREKTIDAIKQLVTQVEGKTSPQWYVNSRGQTMVVIPGPLEFMMGSPKSEKGRSNLELRPSFPRKINRSFAIAAQLVTKEQFLRFNAKFTVEGMERYPAPSCPIGGMRWAEAAAYCNWLSKE